jgi:undecaprenyl-diphosphatase
VLTGRLAAASAVCALLFVGLGLQVTRRPARLDALAARRGTNFPLAVAFTQSGYGLALTLLGAGSIAAALALRAPAVIPLAILVAQIGSQAAVHLAKAIFARPRPAAWVYRHEPGFAYPSGHATTAVVFYGAWLVVLWNAALPLPVRAGGAALLAAWALGVGWSRVALGAHAPTDVIGGFLFGLAWLCAMLAIAVSRGAGLVTRHA